MNEWVAFGVVAVICGLLAILMRWSPDENSRTPDTQADSFETRTREDRS